MGVKVYDLNVNCLLYADDDSYSDDAYCIIRIRVAGIW